MPASNTPVSSNMLHLSSGASIEVSLSPPEGRPLTLEAWFNSTADIDAWSHTAITYDGNDYTLYKNGVIEQDIIEVCAVQDLDLKTMVFAVTRLGQIWFCKQETAEWDSPWTKWYTNTGLQLPKNEENVPDNAVYDLQAINLGDGRIGAFAKFPNGKALLYCAQLQNVANAQFSQWYLLYVPSDGIIVNHFTVTKLVDNRLQAFALCSDGKIYISYQLAADWDSFWSNWESNWNLSSLPANLKEISAGYLLDNRTQIFAVDNAGKIWSCWQKYADENSEWSEWTSEWNVASPTPYSIVRLATTRLCDYSPVIFGINIHGDLSYCQFVKETSSWSNWTSFKIGAHTSSNLIVARLASLPLNDLRSQIFAIDKNGKLWSSNNQSNKINSAWSLWTQYWTKTPLPSKTGQSVIPHDLLSFINYLIGDIGGTIRELRIWDYARSTDELQSCMLTQPIGAQGLKAYLDFTQYPPKEISGSGATFTVSGNYQYESQSLVASFQDYCGMNIGPTSLLYEKPFSFEILMYPTSLSTGSERNTLFQLLDYELEVEHEVQLKANVFLLEEGYLGCYINNQMYKSTSQPFKINEWYLLSVTYDNNNIKAYINGNSIALVPSNIIFYETMHSSFKQVNENITFINVGQNYEHLNNQFYGYMQELRFWNICRTEEEINAGFSLIDPNLVSDIILYTTHTYDVKGNCDVNLSNTSIVTLTKDNLNPGIYQYNKNNNNSNSKVVRSLLGSAEIKSKSKEKITFANNPIRKFCSTVGNYHKNKIEIIEEGGVHHLIQYQSPNIYHILLNTKADNVGIDTLEEAQIFYELCSLVNNMVGYEAFPTNYIVPAYLLAMNFPEFAGSFRQIIANGNISYRDFMLFLNALVSSGILNSLLTLKGTNDSWHINYLFNFIANLLSGSSSWDIDNYISTGLFMINRILRTQTSVRRDKEEKIEITMYQAKWGDSFLIDTYSKDGDNIIWSVLLVDGGPRGVYPEIKYDIPPKIDHVFATHIDEDHLYGLIDMFKDTSYIVTSNIYQAQQSNSFRYIGDLRFNCPRTSLNLEEVGNHPAVIKAFGENGLIKEISKGKSIEEIISLLPDDLAFDLGSKAQAEALRDAAIGKNISIYDAFSGARAPVIDLGTAFIFTYNGPSQRNRDKFNAAWTNDTLNAEITNRQSIIFEISSTQYSSVNLLMTGDAWDLQRNDYQGRQRLSNEYKTDVRGPQAPLISRISNVPKKYLFLKVPHHASDKTTDQNFYQNVIADNYLISASQNGANNFPTFNVLQWIIQSNMNLRDPNRTFNIYITNINENVLAIQRHPNLNPVSSNYNLYCLDESQKAMTFQVVNGIIEYPQEGLVVRRLGYLPPIPVEVNIQEGTLTQIEKEQKYSAKTLVQHMLLSPPFQKPATDNSIEEERKLNKSTIQKEIKDENLLKLI